MSIPRPKQLQDSPHFFLLKICSLKKMYYLAPQNETDWRNNDFVQDKYQGKTGFWSSRSVRQP
jgi:hypothetical protein